jgi:hypothetical protein
MPKPVKSDPPARRFSFGLGHLVFLAAFALRLWNLLGLTSSALLLPTRGDMHFYNDWAHEILQGRFAQHLAFYGLPGYPYFLAGLYKLFGENPFIPALFQAVADAAVALLIYQICLRIFGSLSSTRARAIGLIAAAGWVFCVPAQAYSVVLMPTALFVFVFWFVAWRIVRKETAPSTAETLVVALLVGITATAVATIVALLPLFVAAILFKPEDGRPARQLSALRLVLLTVSIAAGMSPCWIHNYFIAKDPVALSAHSGINFWIGNNPEANGYPRFPPGLRAGQAAMLEDSITQAEAAAGRSLKHAEVSAYWSSKARFFVINHFGEWLKLIARKFRNFWSAFQYDDLSIITSLREQNIVLPGISFGVIAAFAIPGILFAWRLAPRSRWITAAIVLSILALLAVFITERYRLVAVPGLLIFAAFGLAIFWEAFRAAKFRAAGIYIVIVVAATMVVAWPQRDPSLWALDAYNSGWQALESNNVALAEKKLAVAYAYVPGNSETLFALGNLRFAQNNRAAAESFYLATLNADQKHKGAFNNLGVLALDVSQFDEAEIWFRRAEDVDPRNAKTHFLLAKTLLGKNARAAARTEIDAAIALKSDQAEFKVLKQQIEQE